jgi:hypothetical protein
VGRARERRPRGTEETSSAARAAIRGFCEDFVGTFEGHQIESEEILELGGGVMFSVIQQQGCPAGMTE